MVQSLLRRQIKQGADHGTIDPDPDPGERLQLIAASLQELDDRARPRVDEAGLDTRDRGLRDARTFGELTLTKPRPASRLPHGSPDVHELMIAQTLS